MKLADFIILVLAAGINILMFANTRNQQVPDRVQIQVGDHAPIEVALAADQTLDIEGLIGMARLQIRDGAIRFLESPGRHKVCLRHGWLRHRGESSACVPNGLSVRLTGGTQRFDSTNY